MIGAAILGLLVGLPSRRLIGDYLAIVTLFFGEAFVEFTNNVAPRHAGRPQRDRRHRPDPASSGYQLTTNTGYFYLLLVLLVVTMAVLQLLDTSRTGRAWRAVREDPLAAASMTIPVNRVKLMAFAFGAMVAALAGTVFAAQQISVFPTDFNTAYPDPDLRRAHPRRRRQHRGRGPRRPGRRGHLDGLLRSPTESGYIFYGLILVTLVVKLRPWRRLGSVLAATVALGFAAHAIAGAISARAVAGGPQSGGWIGSALRDWVIVPASPQTAGNIGFRAAGVPADRAGAGQGRWRTILLRADALPGRVRVGGQAASPSPRSPGRS